MQVGNLDFDDEAMIYARENESLLCVDIVYDGEIKDCAHINKEEAQRIVNHLIKVFELSVQG